MAKQVTTCAVDRGKEGGSGNDLLEREQVQHIILVDTHSLMRLALQRILVTFPNVCISANFSSIHGMFAVLDRKPPDCSIVLLGPSLPLSDCLQFMELLRKQQVLCRVVAIQQSFQPETARTLIEQGVNGLLDEHAAEEDLERAIKAASLNTLFLSRHTRHMLAVSMERPSDRLTRREIQVLSRLKHGETNFRIARGLGLKEKTIEKYLTSIYEKLNVHSRTEALLCLQKLHF